MRYAALDFEVGNANLISACAVGVSVFEDFTLLKRYGLRIRPPFSAGKFHWGNVRVHGIRREDVEHAPLFDELWPGLRDDLEGSVIVCHNAAFDTAVLCACLDYFRLPYPSCRYLCTVKISQAVWPDLENHRLNTLAQALGIPLDHHEAGSDAHAAGLLLLKALRQTGCENAEALCQTLKLPMEALGAHRLKAAQAREKRRRRAGKPPASAKKQTEKERNDDERVFDRSAKH